PCGVDDERQCCRTTDRARRGREARRGGDRPAARGERAAQARGTPPGRRAAPGPVAGRHDPEGHRQARARQARRMTEPRRIELNLLGQTLGIRSEAAPEYLRTLAKVREEGGTALRLSGIKDPLTSLALAALDITDELFRARDDKTRDE